jgi:pimeloyl-ACP methyl ester carboxylesterase
LSALAELTATGAGASHGTAPIAVRERRFSAQDGLILFYREYGHPASGRIPLLCLPGLTRNSKDFDALALRYASDRRVVCPDYRGRGRSAYDPDYRNYTPRTHLSDLLHLLTVAALGAVVVIGTSAGGLMAMALAVARPACLRGVVLNDIGPDVAAGGRERIANYVGKAETPRDWAAAATYCRDVWGPARPDGTDADWDRIAHQTFVAGDGEVLRLDHDVRVGRALKESGGAPADAWRWFGALGHIPTLAIRGENSDVLSPATFERMAEVKPDLMRLTVPRRGHAPDLGEPECLEAIDDFLSQL